MPGVNHFRARLAKEKQIGWAEFLIYEFRDKANEAQAESRISGPQANSS